jgi:hypothetical protein
LFVVFVVFDLVVEFVLLSLGAGVVAFGATTADLGVTAGLGVAAGLTSFVAGAAGVTAAGVATGTLAGFLTVSNSCLTSCTP